MPSSYYPFGSQCRDAYSMFQPPISAECAAAQPGEDTWRCVCGEFMLPHVLTPSQVPRVRATCSSK